MNRVQRFLQRTMVLAGVLCLTTFGCQEAAKQARPASNAAPALVQRAAETSKADAGQWLTLEAARTPTRLSAIVRASVATAKLSVSHNARVRGIHAAVGSRVKKGNPLVDIDSEDLLLESVTYLAVRSQLKVHRGRLEELKALQRQKLASRAEIFEREAKIAELSRTRDLAAASLRSANLVPSKARSYVDKGYFTIDAPIDGVLVEMSVRVGQSVQAYGASLGKVVGTSVARVEVRTQERVASANKLKFEGLNGVVAPLRGPPVSSVVDAESGNHLSWYEVEGDVLLPDGLRGFVSVEDAPPAFSVPAAWIGTPPSIRRRRDGVITQIPVKVAREDSDRVWIRGELEAGDQIAKSTVPRSGGNPR